MWLKAHQIRELVILQAQQLAPDATERVRHWARSQDLDLALLYCGAGLRVQPTTTVEAVLNRPRRPAIPEAKQPPWPQIEEVDLLDYRAQCFCQLTDTEYLRVDRALRGSANRIRWFFDDITKASRSEFGRATGLATATQDDQLREILLKGALIGLLRHGRALTDTPPTRRPAFEPHPVSQHQLNEFLEDINPRRAAVRFLRHWTHLSDRRLSVIGPEQITSTTVAGIEIPAEMQPTFRAAIAGGSDNHPWSPFAGGVWASTQRWIVPEADPPADHDDEPRSMASYSDRPEVAARILSQALTLAAHWAISRKKIPPSSRQDIEDLHERGLLFEIYPDEYEITTKAIHGSATVSATHLDVGATPEEILLFLLKHGREYKLPKYRDATTKEERKLSRLVRLLADLLAYGHTNPHGLTRYLADALENLRQGGYIAHFGPFGYRLSERGVYSLCWNDEQSAFPSDPSDFDPPPRQKSSDAEPRNLGQAATEKAATKRPFP